MRIAIIIFTILFGLMTLKEGGSTLFLSSAENTGSETAVPFVLWFNFLTGFAFLALGFGLIKNKIFPKKLSAVVSLLSALVLTAFLITVALGGAHMDRTLVAMPLRTAIWLGLWLWIRGKLLRTSATLLLIFLTPFSGISAEVGGVLFSDQISVDPTSPISKSLFLNGAGIHQVTLFKVRALAAALYAESKSKEGAQLLNTNQIRKIHLQFLISIGGKKAASAWIDQIKEGCEPQCEALQERLEKMRGFFEDFKKTDTMEMTFYADQVEFSVRGSKKGTIEGADFSKAVLGLWIGDKPLSKDLKRQLLGI